MGDVPSDSGRQEPLEQRMLKWSILESAEEECLLAEEESATGTGREGGPSMLRESKAWRKSVCAKSRGQARGP